MDAIAEIAREYLHIDTLEVRNSDSLDFHEVYVRNVREAIWAAMQFEREECAKIAEKPIFTANENDRAVAKAIAMLIRQRNADRTNDGTHATVA